MDVTAEGDGGNDTVGPDTGPFDYIDLGRGDNVVVFTYYGVAANPANWLVIIRANRADDNLFMSIIDSFVGVTPFSLPDSRVIFLSVSVSNFRYEVRDLANEF